MFFEQAVGAVVGGVEDSRDLFVDHLRRMFAELTVFLHDLTAQEWVFFAGPVGDRTDPLAHAPVGDHAAGEPSRFLQVVFRPGTEFVERQFLGRPSAEHEDQPRVEVTFADIQAVFLGQQLGHAECPTAGNDRHFVHHVGARDDPRQQGMARFVEGGHPLFFWR